jgi:hypothetical protein
MARGYCREISYPIVCTSTSRPPEWVTKGREIEEGKQFDIAAIPRIAHPLYIPISRFIYTNAPVILRIWHGTATMVSVCLYKLHFYQNRNVKIIRHETNRPKRTDSLDVLK